MIWQVIGTLRVSETVFARRAAASVLHAEPALRMNNVRRRIAPPALTDRGLVAA
jgi:hypothetical protein